MTQPTGPGVLQPAGQLQSAPIPSLSRAMVSPVGLPVASLTTFTSTPGFIFIDWRDIAVKNRLSVPATTQPKPEGAAPQRSAVGAGERSQPTAKRTNSKHHSLERIVGPPIGSCTIESTKRNRSRSRISSESNLLSFAAANKTRVQGRQSLPAVSANSPPHSTPERNNLASRHPLISPIHARPRPSGCQRDGVSGAMCHCKT
jgi:hypothetical protein